MEPYLKMNWDERAKKLKQDNRYMWETLPDNPEFKKRLTRILVMIALFPWSLVWLVVGLTKIDYDKVDYLADLYRDKLMLFALYHPLEVGTICVIFGVIGCAWLVKRAMQ